MTIEALKLALEALENHTAIKHPQQIHYRDKAITAIKEALAGAEGERQPEQKPVAWHLPPIVEPTAKTEPVYIMGSYVGTGEVASVTLGGVSFTGNGTAGREADANPTGFFFQADKRQPKQEPVGEVYGWHGHGVGQPLCRFNVTEAEMPVGSLLYTIPPQPKEPEQEPVACVGPWHDGRLTLIPRYSQQTFEHDQPLYTTPPQRTWVGLTPEEVEACIHHVDEDGIGLFDFAEAIEAKLKEKNT